VTDCGMQAVALVCDTLLVQSSHMIAMRQVYNKTRAFFDWSAKRVGAALDLVDDGDLDALARAMRPETRFVFAETYTNPLTRAQDVPAIADILHRVPGARVVIDGTISS